MKKLLNPITKVTGAVTSSITYNTMTSYTYVAIKPVCKAANKVKDTTTKTTSKLINKLTKKDK